MPNSTTETSIIDRGLQILGYSEISSPQQVGSRGAKAMRRAYKPVKLSELQKNMWHFAIKRALIAASGTPPVHTKKNAFPLPGDCLMLAPEDQDGQFPLNSGRIVEGGAIISDEDGPIKIRYVSADVSETLFDAIFAEMLSAALAIACGEELTNSQSKIQTAGAIYDEQVKLARNRGAILNPKPRVPVSSWISSRG